MITSDGTTILGADDKAGIAEILTLIERLNEENIPHGPLCVAFTPDEETGTGAAHLILISSVRILHTHLTVTLKMRFSMRILMHAVLL